MMLSLLNTMTPVSDTQLRLSTSEVVQLSLVALPVKKKARASHIELVTLDGTQEETQSSSVSGTWNTVGCGAEARYQQTSMRPQRSMTVWTADWTAAASVTSTF